MVWDPTNSDIHYVITDKEIVRTTDAGETYTFKSKGFNAAHTVNISAAPNYNIAAFENSAGAIFKTNANPDPLNQAWKELPSDVVGKTQISTTQPDNMFGQRSDGGLVQSLNRGETWAAFYGPPILPTHPSLGTSNRYIDRNTDTTAGGNLWDSGDLPPFSMFELDEYIPPTELKNDTLVAAVPIWGFFCSQKYLWCITNPIGTLDSISNWNRVSGAITNGIITPGFYKHYITALGVAKDGSHSAYVGTNDGSVFRVMRGTEPLTHDITRASRFAKIATGGTHLPKRWITDIAVDPNNHNNVVITMGGYESSDSSMIYVTNNATDTVSAVTWRSIGHTMPANFSVYTVAFHPEPSIGALLIGTEKGVYTTTSNISTPGAIVWTEDNTGLPKVPVWDIYIRPYVKVPIGGGYYEYAEDNTIFIATNGRGVWKSSSLVSRPDDELVKGGIDQTQLKAYPNPASDLSTIEIDLPVFSTVRVELYTITGVKVATIANKDLREGNHKIQVDVNNLESGIYLVRTSIANKYGDGAKTTKLIVMH